jgi:integrase
MRVRRTSSGKTYYYLETRVSDKRTTIPLGQDYVEALRRYADLVTTATAPAVTVPELLSKWNAETAAGRPRGTMQDIGWALPNLLEFFSSPEPAPLNQVEPVHITQYLRWRVASTRRAGEERNKKRAAEGRPPLPIRQDVGAVRGNREIAWLSAAWNWGRSTGLTSVINPCHGVRRNRENGRKIYIEDDEMAAIMAHADAPLREAIELAYLIGQRPGDLLSLRETDIRDGSLHIEQAKTGTTQRIEVVGMLADLLDRIRARKVAIKGGCSASLLVTDKGESLSRAMMRRRFELAREAAAVAAGSPRAAARIRTLQFRDLRAKAATDKADQGGVAHAQQLLGHSEQAMTEAYIRQRRGAKVTPVK